MKLEYSVHLEYFRGQRNQTVGEGCGGHFRDDPSVKEYI